MKTLYLIGGAMGVGKTTVCRELQKRLPANIYLDGDWCLQLTPFTVTEETKKAIMDHIVFLLNGDIHLAAAENVIFSWVMHRQEILDELRGRLKSAGVKVVSVSLVCTEETLRARLQRDVDAGIRTADVIGRSLSYLPLYEELDTVKVPTDGKTPGEIADGLIRIADGIVPPPTLVSAALIRDGKGRFMICRRPAHKKRGLLWEFVGGKAEAGETPEEALIRETREELGVTVKPLGLFTEVLHVYPDLTVRLMVFNAVITEGTPVLLEHCDLRWITPDEIGQYEFCPADTEILALIRERFTEGHFMIETE